MGKRQLDEKEKKLMINNIKLKEEELKRDKQLRNILEYEIESRQPFLYEQKIIAHKKDLKATVENITLNEQIIKTLKKQISEGVEKK